MELYLSLLAIRAQTHAAISKLRYNMLAGSISFSMLVLVICLWMAIVTSEMVKGGRKLSGEQ